MLLVRFSVPVKKRSFALALALVSVGMCSRAKDIAGKVIVFFAPILSRQARTKREKKKKLEERYLNPSILSCVVHNLLTYHCLVDVCSNFRMKTTFHSKNEDNVCPLGFRPSMMVHSDWSRSIHFWLDQSLIDWWNPTRTVSVWSTTKRRDKSVTMISSNDRRNLKIRSCRRDVWKIVWMKSHQSSFFSISEKQNRFQSINLFHWCRSPHQRAQLLKGKRKNRAERQRLAMLCAKG